MRKPMAFRRNQYNFVGTNIIRGNFIFLYSHVNKMNRHSLELLNILNLRSRNYLQVLNAPITTTMMPYSITSQIVPETALLQVVDAVIEASLENAYSMAPNYTNEEVSHALEQLTHFERSNENCSICITSYTEESGQGVLTNCNHRFHEHCLRSWLRRNGSCPICRAMIIIENNNNASN